MMAESGEDSGNASSGSISPSLSPSDGMSEMPTTPPAKPPLLSSAENSAPLWTRFHVDAYFDSFDDFWDAYEAWCDKHFHTFRTASSEALKEADGSMQDRFRFRYIVLHCIHYGQPRTRGGNSRARQSYLPCGCRASIRISFCYTKKKLRITTLKTEHTNHEVSEEAYAKWKNKANKRRSRGEKMEEEDEKDEDSEQENMDEEWELKKERKTKALKRKMEPKSTPVAPAQASEPDPPVKRKRGRPRKHPLPTEDSIKEVAAVKNEKITPPKEPKKRGSKISDDRNSNNLSSEVAVEEASEVAVKDLCKNEEKEEKKVQECKVDTAAVMAAFLASEFEKDRSNGEDAVELTATPSRTSNEAMEPPPILQAESPQLLNNFKHEPLVQGHPVQSSSYSIQRPPPQPTTIPKHYQLNLVQSPAFSLPTPQQIIPPQMILPQVIQQPVLPASRDVSFNALLYAYACMVQQQQDQRVLFTGDQPTTQ